MPRKISIFGLGMDAHPKQPLPEGILLGSDCISDENDALLYLAFLPRHQYSINNISDEIPTHISHNFPRTFERHAVFCNIGLHSYDFCHSLFSRISISVIFALFKVENDSNFYQNFSTPKMGALTSSYLAPNPPPSRISLVILTGCS